MLDNGEIDNDFFETYKFGQQAAQVTTREERLGKDLVTSMTLTSGLFSETT
jgi:hypothetical protein